MKSEFRTKIKKTKVEIDGIEYVEFDAIMDIFDEIEGDINSIATDLAEFELKFY